MKGGGRKEKIMSPRLAPIFTGEEMGLTNNSGTYYLQFVKRVSMKLH